MIKHKIKNNLQSVCKKNKNSLVLFNNYQELIHFDLMIQLYCKQKNLDYYYLNNQTSFKLTFSPKNELYVFLKKKEAHRILVIDCTEFSFSQRQLLFDLVHTRQLASIQLNNRCNIVILGQEQTNNAFPKFTRALYVIPSDMYENTDCIIQDSLFSPLKVCSQPYNNFFINLKISKKWHSIFLTEIQKLWTELVTDKLPANHQEINICLLNPPKNLPDFKRFWRRTNLQRFFWAEDKKIFIPQNIKFSYKYQVSWEELLSRVEFCPYNNQVNIDAIINPTIIYRLFFGHEHGVTEANTSNGLMEEFKLLNDTYLSFLADTTEQDNITMKLLAQRNINKIYWSRILLWSYALKVKLKIYVVPGVIIPAGNTWQEYPKNDNENLNFISSKVLVSNNVNVTINRLYNQYKLTQQAYALPGDLKVIDISGLSANELSSLPTKITADKVTATFCALEKHLYEGNPLILYGDLSLEQIDVITSWLLTNAFIYYRGSNIKTIQKVTLVTNPKTRIPHLFPTIVCEQQMPILACDTTFYPFKETYNKIITILATNKIINFIGDAHSGKTNFVLNTLKPPRYTLFVGEEKINEWAYSTPINNESLVLFIDHKTLFLPRMISILSGITYNRPYVLSEGNFINVSAKHKVIITSNEPSSKWPTNYNIKNIFFKEPHIYYFYHKTIHPLIHNHSDVYFAKKIKTHILSACNEIFAERAKTFSINTRELQTIALLLLAKHSISKAKIELSFLTKIYAEQICLQSKCFYPLSQIGTRRFESLIDSLFLLRNYRTNCHVLGNNNLHNLIDGHHGLLLTTEQGDYSHTFIRNLMQKNKILEQDPFAILAKQDNEFYPDTNSYYILSTFFDFACLKKLLIHAFHCGSIVVFYHLDYSHNKNIDHLLTNLLSGIYQHKKALTPGFMLLATKDANCPQNLFTNSLHHRFLQGYYQEHTDEMVNHKKRKLSPNNQVTEPHQT